MTDRVNELCDQIGVLLAQLRAEHAKALADCAPAAPPATAPGARFRACMSVVFSNEGGFVNNPADPGGATNMGITHATLGSWRNEDVTEQDVRNLTKEEAMRIYEARYWLPNRCDQMAPGVDLAVLDFAVNSGRAISQIQKKIGVTADGAVGPQTLATLALFDPADLVERICDLRLVYLRSLGAWPDFAKGWTARVAKVRTIGLKMARGQAFTL